MKWIFPMLILLGISFISASHAHAQGAILKLEPSTGTFFVGSTFETSIVLDTRGENINTVDLTLKFPPNKLQVTSPSTGKSFISVWAQPPNYSNKEGTIHFVGGVPDPGINTSRGIISTITFRVQEPGDARIEFAPNSKVFLNDGLATDILASSRGAVYSLEVPPPLGPKVHSSTHPDFNTWYPSRDIELKWDKEGRVTAFSYIFDQTLATIPDIVSEGEEPGAFFNDIEDGLWYFHIRAKKDGKWGGTTTFPVRIDAIPPAEPTIEISPASSSSSSSSITTAKSIAISFFSTDARSGIDYYQLKVIDVGTAEDTGIQPFFINVQSPHLLGGLGSGLYSAIVRSYDRAGNWSEGIHRIEVVTPFFAFLGREGIKMGDHVLGWPVMLIPVFLIILILGFFLLRAWKRHLDLKARFYGDLSTFHSRLKKDMGEIDGKLQEDFVLKQRFREELDGIEKILGDKVKKHGPSPSVDRKTEISKLGIFFLLFGFSFIFMSSSAFAEVLDTEQGRSVTPPIIETYSKEIGSNERLYLSGRADPDTSVKVYIAQKDQEPLIGETTSFTSGEWNYLHDKFIQPGVYQVYAKAVTEQGEESEFGPQVFVNVISRSVTLGGLVLGYETVFGVIILVLIVLVIILSGSILFFWVRSSRLREHLTREILEAEEAVRRSFHVLRRDLQKEVELLGEAKFKDRTLSREEHALRKRLVEDFERMEKWVRKEVYDIEKQLK